MPKQDKQLASGLADHLVHDGLLSAEEAQTILHAARQQENSFLMQVLSTHILSEETILTYCQEKFGLTIFDLKNYDLAWLNQPTLSTELLHRYQIIPLHQDEHYLHLGITDPTQHSIIPAISFQTGLPIYPKLVSLTELNKILQGLPQQILHNKLAETLAKIDPPEENMTAFDEENDEPIIEFVDQLITDARQKHISDIHIEPYEQHCRIRFRRDGLLYEATQIPNHLALRIITRLKIMAQLNIAERRMPQDGRIQMQKAAIDIRINTCPTLFGEKIVLRLLHAQSKQLDIHALGLTTQQSKLLLEKLQLPQGLILVTGPTGSGKTITLYTALHYLNQIEKNISTVEDPVEIKLTGINQVNIHTKIGLDFATVLRTFLRQDPDIIMVGEIRDKETAAIATQAAQTGHLVLSTLHTHHALSALTRLEAMGIAPYNLTSALSLIIAQRLLRKLCNACKQPEQDSSNLQKILPDKLVYRATGCEHCQQGYNGRIGIFECIPMSEKIIALILNRSPTAEILKQVNQENHLLLWAAGMEKVAQGLTSFTEVLRILGNHWL